MEDRNALGEFLRSRRERLHPRDVGLAQSGRRRTPGLLGWWSASNNGCRAGMDKPEP